MALARSMHRGWRAHNSKLAFFRSFASRRCVIKTLVIKDLAIEHVSASKEGTSVRSPSREERKLVQGGRAISVLVDGRPGGVVDDFDLNRRIFTGEIGVRVV